MWDAEMEGRVGGEKGKKVKKRYQLTTLSRSDSLTYLQPAGSSGGGVATERTNRHTALLPFRSQYFAESATARKSEGARDPTA